MLLHPNRQTRLALSWPMLKLISHTTKPCQGRVPKTSQFFVLSCPRPAHTKGAASRATSLVALVSFGTLPIHVSLTPSAVHLPKTMQQKGGPDQADPCPAPEKGDLQVTRVSYYLAPTSHQISCVMAGAMGIPSQGFRLLGLGPSSPKRVRILLSSS